MRGGGLTGLFLVLDFLLAVVKQEELEPVLGIIVSFVRYMAVILRVVAKATGGVVLDQSADFGAPAGRVGGVQFRHLVVVVVLRASSLSLYVFESSQSRRLHRWRRILFSRVRPVKASRD